MTNAARRTRIGERCGNVAQLFVPNCVVKGAFLERWEVLVSKTGDEVNDREQE